ncbi:MAG: helix-turn-helix transcriptional regulator [Clostridia bacterium]|nr:helix-turn-helix transcriptional regulator [Clostridia bacterium]MBO7216118.1 helix-turn-helix transcriptional regulator [Clostridia bacterium]MBO7245837.1 helix-turn-helix transcriptional regulator [Clostridia bacterium]MBO7738053.1 helix-turn-helix transcriptional regulator [Clostridia bacterium]
MLGNKLYELRKQAGLSQEAFAEKLGVSRQAVSKWECGASLPDTDNLITIANLYNISLDELIGRPAPAKPDEAQDEDDKEDAEAEAYYSDDGTPADTKRKTLRILHALPYPIFATAVFLLWGFLLDGWGIAWTVFITIPVYYSVLECVRTKRFSPFAYPVFITFVYCILGMQWDLWHPCWILYITIPIYYAAASAIDKRK